MRLSAATLFSIYLRLIWCQPNAAFIVNVHDNFIAHSNARQNQGYRDQSTSSSIVLFASDETRLERQLLDDFRVAGGEVINPYKVLKVSRSATRQEIKQSYRSLSRRYHPDGILQRKDGILPGRCNSMDDVREEWERIKLAYEILTDKKMRARYDRNSAIADPAAAMGRAALGTVGWGLSTVGKGLFTAGKMALDHTKKDTKNS